MTASGKVAEKILLMLSNSASCGLRPALEDTHLPYASHHCRRNLFRPASVFGQVAHWDAAAQYRDVISRRRNRLYYTCAVEYFWQSALTLLISLGTPVMGSSLPSYSTDIYPL